MNDVILLGIICLGLAVYVLYIRYKITTMVFIMQALLQGIYEDKVKIVQRDDGLYYPELKKGTGIDDSSKQ